MKIICIGRNYAEHARELGNEVPTEPVIFMKPQTALLRDQKAFYIPDFSNDIHYEAELVYRICNNGRHVKPKFTKDYYAEVTVGIDFTARDIQQELKDKGLPWEKAKAFDHSAVVGQFYPINDVLDKEGEINFSLNKNSEIVQKGNTKFMFHNIDEIITYVSKFFMLNIGDFIFTGTPAGVGSISINDEFEGFLGDKKVLQCDIK